MSKIIVLGAGMVGRTMALDLAKKHDVTSVDISENSLTQLPAQITKMQFDLGNTAGIARLAESYDIVLSAVPGFMGYKTLQAILEAGKKCGRYFFLP